MRAKANRTAVRVRRDMGTLPLFSFTGDATVGGTDLALYPVY